MWIILIWILLYCALEWFKTMDRRIVIHREQEVPAVRGDSQRIVIIRHSFCRRMPGAKTGHFVYVEECVETLFMDPARTWITIAAGPPYPTKEHHLH